MSNDMSLLDIANEIKRHASPDAQQAQDQGATTNEGSTSENKPNNISDVHNNNSQRPDYLLDKFNSVEDQAKSYMELERKLGQRRAPHEYYVPDAMAQMENLSELKKMMFDADVSQDNFEKIISKIQVKPQYDANEEWRKLGDNAQHRVDKVTSKLRDILPEDQFKSVTKNLRTADQVTMYEKLLESRGQSTPMVSNSAEPEVKYGRELHDKILAGIRSGAVSMSDPKTSEAFYRCIDAMTEENIQKERAKPYGR